MHVGIIGKMNSGKTTLAKMFQERGYERIAFADPVKEISGMMLSVFKNYVDSSLNSNQISGIYYSKETMNEMKGHPSIRGLLQFVGTELGRQWVGSEDTWVDLFEAEFKRRQSACSFTRVVYHVVNDDCRFHNEVDRLKSLGFTIIKIERDEEERTESVLASVRRDNPNLDENSINLALVKTLYHSSETMVDDLPYDVLVKNDSLDSLKDFVQQTIQR